MEINSERTNLAFKYYFPLLGKIEFGLGDVPKRTFELLEKLGEIDRLKNLNHIGSLGLVFPGMKQSRYDYTILTLYLIHLISAFKLPGLSSSKELKNISLSGRDFLQLFTLVSNIGHVPGTFAVEKGILKFLIEQNRVEQLLSGFNQLDLTDEQVSELKTWMIKGQKYFLTNKLLALVKLCAWLEDGRLDDDEKGLLVELAHILFIFILPEKRDEHEENLFEIYDIVRRIAYLTQDSVYSTKSIQIDLQSFILNLATKAQSQEPQAKEILSTNFRELIYQFEKGIYNQIYHSEKSTVLTSIVVKQVYKFLKEKDAPISEILGWLTSQQLNDISLNWSKIQTGMEAHIAELSMQFGGNESFLVVENLVEKGLITLENELLDYVQNTHLKINCLYLPPLKPETFGEMWFDLIYPKSCSAERIRDLVKVLCYFYKKIDTETYFGMSVIYRELLSRMLICALKKEEFEPRIIEHPHEFFGTGGEDRLFCVPNIRDKHHYVQPWIKEEYFSRKVDPDWPRFKKDKFHEHQALWELLKYLGKSLYKIRTEIGGSLKVKQTYRLRERLFLVVPASIIIMDKSSALTVVEFDGAVLEVKAKSGKTILYLLEAKNVYSSFDQARRELENKFREKLNLPLPTIQKLGKKDAFAVWQLN